MTADKITCETPTPGKKPTRIPRWKYEAVRSAILGIVPARGRGVPFGELPRLVAKRLSDDERDRLGSVGWHTTTVKLHLEVLGEIRRMPGVSPQRLLRG